MYVCVHNYSVTYVTCLCINQPFTAKSQDAILHHTLADYDNAFLFSTPLFVLKLYNTKRNTVENVDLDKRAVFSKLNDSVSHVRIAWE